MFPSKLGESYMGYMVSNIVNNTHIDETLY